MDMVMVDITGIPCKEGDDADIFGEITSAETLAGEMQSISYELLTAIGQRVKRVILR